MACHKGDENIDALSSEDYAIRISPSESSISITSNKSTVDSTTNTSDKTSIEEISEDKSHTVEKSQDNHTITIDGEDFIIDLYSNQTVNEILTMFPLNITMEDLNSNEKFCNLDQNLSTNAQPIGQIFSGDLMLYGANCLVLFYETFPTTYNYTPIGKVRDNKNLINLRAVSNIKVQIN